jgi:outer membrane protein assembly factor BamB
VVLAALLIAALVGVALIGSGLIDRPPFAVAPTDATPEATASTSSSAEMAACPGVEPPGEMRISELDLPDIDTGPFGRPVVAGCAVWITSGDNGGGIHRIDLATGEVSNVNPAEVVFDVDADDDDLLAIGRPAVLVGDAAATLFRIDPASGAVLGQIPVDSHGTVLRVVDGRAWIGGWRGGLILYDLANGAIVDSWPAGDVGTIEVGAGAVWVISSSDQGPALTRTDLSTLEQTSVPIPRGFTDVAIADDRVYVASEFGQVSQIDPATGAVITSAQIEGWTQGFVGLAVEGSSVWVLPIVMVPFGSEFRLASTELLRVDAATGQIADRIEYAASQPIDLWATDGNLWLYEAERGIVRFELPALR